LAQLHWFVFSFEGSWELSSQEKTAGTGGVEREEEHLPSKHETVNSNPNATKKTQKNQTEEDRRLVE
jgi:hypothetical protein